METIWKYLKTLRDSLKVLGAICLMGMTLLTCADVVGRYLGHPSVELVGFMAILAVALALPYTHGMKGHIGVEILVNTLSEKKQAVFDLCTNIIALILFAVVTWRMARYAVTFRNSGEVSMNLEFPEHLIIYATAFCFLIFTLTIIEGIFNAIKLLMGPK